MAGLVHPMLCHTLTDLGRCPADPAEYIQDNDIIPFSIFGMGLIADGDVAPFPSEFVVIMGFSGCYDPLLAPNSIESKP